MNYTEFINAMMMEVKAQMEPEVKVELHVAVKNNSMVRQGLMLKKDGINVSPTIYLEEFFEQYQKGQTMSALTEAICQIYEEIKVDKPFPGNEMLSYEQVRGRIAYKLINWEKNWSLLQTVPHDKYLGLAVVYYILMESTAFGTATFLVENRHLREWHVTKEEIAKCAEENMERMLPVKVTRLTNFMYIVTNIRQSLGAAVIRYRNTCELLAEELQDNFYILPSSIHEMLLIPEHFGMNRAELKEMVREINTHELKAEDVLGEEVYYYERKEKKIRI